MNVLFICDWDLTYLWEKVARRLIFDGKAKECNALIVGKLYYEMYSKKDHVFNKLWLLQEYVENPESVALDMSKLRSIEKKYGNPTLWRFLWADRSFVFYPYEDACKLLISAFDFYEKLYSEAKPSVIVTHAFASMAQLVGYEVAKNMGIPVLNPINSKISNYMIPNYDPYQSLEWVDRYKAENVSFSKRSKDVVDKFINDFRSNPVKPAAEILLEKSRSKDWRIFLRFFRYIYRYYISGTYSGDHTKFSPLKKLYFILKLKVRRKVIAKFMRWDDFSNTDRYLYFPLHVQPEATTMTQGLFYLDQFSLIQNLAKSIPVDMKIFVKEHPQMVGVRNKFDYERIRNISNVVLVDPRVSSFDMIRNCSVVATITGTSGFEGALMKKPVVVFGDVYYKKLPFVYDFSGKSPLDWGRGIHEILDNHEHSEVELESFLMTLVENGRKMVIMEPNTAPDVVLADENVNEIAEFIFNEFDKCQSFN